MAETVTLTVANAFSTAFEAWKVLPQTKAIQESLVNNESSGAVEVTEGSFMEYKDTDNLIEAKLIDFDEVIDANDLGTPEKCQKDVNWVSKVINVIDIMDFIT